MCGILGIVSSNNIDKESFKNNLLKMIHRGPDDFGLYFDKQVALGQVRLSVIDLSIGGHQPMVSRCEQYVIAYNGEIYNFKEIKEDLLKKGYDFFSDSDTEVVLNGFIEYGAKIVEKLNGMFAFSIYDKDKEGVFLARDRSGIKPLYFIQNTADFLYSSEIKALQDYAENISLNAKILFLLLGYVPEPYTIYENISMFPAGSYGFYKDNKLSITEYESYKFEPKGIEPYREIVSETKKLFTNAVRRHLVSDAPIGVFLSGGLDSSAITAEAAKYKKNLKTLSLVFEDKDLNEEFYQDLVVDKYETKHTKFLINEKRFLDTVDVFLGSMEQPTIDGLNTYLISSAAKKIGLTVVLSGVGGDEIFYGYPSFKTGGMLNFLSKVPYSIIKIFEYSRKYKKLELIQAEQDLACYLPTRALFSPTEIAEILNIDKKRVYSLLVELHKEYNATNIAQTEDKVSFYELNMYMKNQLLRDTDVFGMVHSIEIRVPFLDKNLVDYLLKVEPRKKFGESNKQILTDAFKDSLPQEIFNRSKMGFTLPFESWFRKNINKFDINKTIKNKFINKEITWSRFWAVLVLEKFDGKL